MARDSLLELLALALTVPAFYMAALAYPHSAHALLYGLAALACALVLGRERGLPHQARHATRHLSVLLVGALVLSAALPAGDSMGLVAMRLFTAALVILRMGQSVRPRLWRGSMAHLLSLAIGVLSLCGLGFWWLEPNVHSLGDGMWLAFTTAATVGYGDIVPTTNASKIFAVFVVLLGVSALSLVTAAIAAMWVRSGEKQIEHEILHDLHRQLNQVHQELSALKQLVARDRAPSESGFGPD